MDSASSTADNVRVVVRIRGGVDGNGSKKVYDIDQNSIIGLEDYSSYFTFDTIFSKESTQEDVFEVAVKPLCEEFNKGFNVLVFAYGQTGSGKTYTMEGFSGCSENKGGVIPRAIEAICGYHKGVAASATCQYIEVYNDEIVDLLQAAGSGGAAAVGAITLRSDSSGNNVLAGASESLCASPVEVMSLFRIGSKKRSTSATKSNDTSSRSHAIFIIRSEANNNTFHFVDLAGSERAKKTGAQGQQLREGIEINKGLLALGNVISALATNGAVVGNKSPSPHTHVPYRDSKLTRILQQALGGNSKTLMITCMSADFDDYTETINSLRYSSRARGIQNKAVLATGNGNSSFVVTTAETEDLKRQLLEMRDSHEKEVKELREGIEYNQRERERLRLCLNHKFEEINSLIDSREGLKASYEKYIAELKALFAYTKKVHGGDSDRSLSFGSSNPSTSDSAANGSATSSSEDIDALKEEIYLLRMLRQHDMERIDSLLVTSQPLLIQIPSSPIISQSSSMECLDADADNIINIDANTNTSKNISTSSSSTDGSNADDNSSIVMAKPPIEPMYNANRRRANVVTNSISKVFKQISCFSTSKGRQKTASLHPNNPNNGVMKLSAYDDDIDITQELIISKLKLAEQDMENENLKHEFRRLEEMFVELKFCLAKIQSEVIVSRSSSSRSNSTSSSTATSVSLADAASPENSN